jgi:hypothetical protein
MKDAVRRELVMRGGFAGILMMAHLWAEDQFQQFNNIRYLLSPA